MELFVAGATIVAFLIGFRISGVVPAAARAIGTARAASTVMRSSVLPDDDKEIAVRKAGLSLLGSALSISLRSLVALLAAMVPILLADLAGLADSDTILAFLARWDVILVSSVAVIVIWLFAGSR
jgi:hypothetical protein